jgi:hypothetical protein
MVAARDRHATDLDQAEGGEANARFREFSRTYPDDLRAPAVPPFQLVSRADSAISNVSLAAGVA